MTRKQRAQNGGNAERECPKCHEWHEALDKSWWNEHNLNHELEALNANSSQDPTGDSDEGLLGRLPQPVQDIVHGATDLAEHAIEAAFEVVSRPDPNAQAGGDGDGEPTQPAVHEEEAPAPQARSEPQPEPREPRIQRRPPHPEGQGQQSAQAPTGPQGGPRPPQPTGPTEATGNGERQRMIEEITELRRQLRLRETIIVDQAERLSGMVSDEDSTTVAERPGSAETPGTGEGEGIDMSTTPGATGPTPAEPEIECPDCKALGLTTKVLVSQLMTHGIMFHKDKYAALFGTAPAATAGTGAAATATATSGSALPPVNTEFFKGDRWQDARDYLESKGYTVKHSREHNPDVAVDRVIDIQVLDDQAKIRVSDGPEHAAQPAANAGTPQQAEGGTPTQEPAKDDPMQKTKDAVATQLKEAAAHIIDAGVQNLGTTIPQTKKTSLTSAAVRKFRTRVEGAALEAIEDGARRSEAVREAVQDVQSDLVIHLTDELSRMFPDAKPSRSSRLNIGNTVTGILFGKADDHNS